METGKIRIPQLRRHKSSNRALVEVKGKVIYLGQFGTAEAARAYARLCAELKANNGVPLPQAPPDDISVAEIIAAFWDHCQVHYRDSEGRLSTHLPRIKSALKTTVELYGDLPACQFGPRALYAVRSSWEADRDKDYARSTITGMVQCVRKAFKWAASMELISGSVPVNLGTLEGLRKGRSKAKEPRVVGPVTPEHIEAVRGKVSRVVRAMIDLQLLTAARPGEIVALRRGDIDCSGDIWTARLSHHKTEHMGRQRTIYFGQRAQVILKPFMLRPDAAYLFDPREAERERRAAQHEKRKTPLSCGNRPGTNRKRGRPKRAPGEFYDVASFRRAISRACEAAGIDPAWSPNQLRHTAATAIRKQYGLEAAQSVLGHANAAVTQIYAEVDAARAIRVISEIG